MEKIIKAENRTLKIGIIALIVTVVLGVYLSAPVYNTALDSSAMTVSVGKNGTRVSMKVPTPVQIYIFFNAMGGTLSTDYKIVWNTSQYGTLPTPKKSGYTFKGWYTSKTGGARITKETTVGVKKDKTLYAHWAEVKKVDISVGVLLGVSVTGSKSAAANGTAANSAATLLNINTCSASSLQGLPGIGSTLAARIVDYRTKKKFKTIDDIKNVSGIGKEKFNAIKKYITV